MSKKIKARLTVRTPIVIYRSTLEDTLDWLLGDDEVWMMFSQVLQPEYEAHIYPCDLIPQYDV